MFYIFCSSSPQWLSLQDVSIPWALLMCLVLWVHKQSFQCVPKERSHKVLNQVTWGAKEAKQCHLHQCFQSSYAEIHRSGIDKCGCSSERGQVSILLEHKIPGNPPSFLYFLLKAYCTVVKDKHLTYSNKQELFPCFSSILGGTERYRTPAATWYAQYKFG